MFESTKQGIWCVTITFKKKNNNIGVQFLFLKKSHFWCISWYKLNIQPLTIPVILRITVVFALQQQNVELKQINQ